jgi:hypothetical protein
MNARKDTLTQALIGKVDFDEKKQQDELTEIN